MIKIGLKGLLAHKRRFIATCLAVVVGVAFLAGTLVFGDTATASFDEMFSTGNEGIDAVVRGDTAIGSEELQQRMRLDGALVGSLAAVDGVAAAAPSIEAQGQLVGADGTPIGGDGPPTFAVNWIEDAALNPYIVVEGRAPEQSGEVVVNVGAAEAGGLALGDRTVVRTPALVEVEIVGLATYGDSESLSGATFTAFTLEDAQRWLLDGADKVDSVVLAAADGVSQDELVERISSHLPQGAEAITGSDLTAEQNQGIADAFLGWFETFLLAFSGIALLVATFSIHNTFSIILAQRTRESALLRAVGASRAQVLRSIAVESLLVGVVASAVGVGAGIGLAQAMKGFIDAAALSIEPASLAVAFAVGVVVTLVAGIFPAIKASRVAPMAALRDVAAESTTVSWVRVGLGAVLAAGGVAFVLAAALGDNTTASARSDALLMAGGGGVAAMTGMIVLGPAFARLAAGAIGAPLRAWRGISGGLARQNAMRNPKRTAGTATALMIGVAIVSLFTVLAASAKASIDDTVAGAFEGDFVIINEGWSGVGFDPAMAADLAALPEVDLAAGWESAYLLIDGEESYAAVVDPAALDAQVDLDVVAGSVADLDGTGLAVSEGYAEQEGLELGSVVSAGFADGTSIDLTVGAVFAMDSLTGGIVLPTEVWAPHADQRIHDLVLISLADGVDTEAGRTAVEAVADTYGAGDVQDRGQYVDSVAGELNQVLNIVYVLLALSIVIALMGIGNTLSLSVHERTGELGLLRAVGQTRSQLRTMVRWESVIIAVFGTLGGIGLGMFLAWGVVGAAGEALGSYAAPVGQLAAVVLVGAGVGVIAALRPAWRASRLDVLEAIRAE